MTVFPCSFIILTFTIHQSQSLSKYGAVALPRNPISPAIPSRKSQSALSHLSNPFASHTQSPSFSTPHPGIMALAAPISRNGFSFAGDSFSVTASGHVHRRCTMPELKAHFKTLGSAKDHPAHWYEAQLLHYGLPPSKVKGTAKMRLMEAVNAGKVTVPAPLGALEREMKKEWTALNKKAAAVAVPALKKTAGAKRKAAEVEVVTTTKTTGTSSVSVSVTVNTAGEKPAAKRAKRAAKPTTAAKATPTKTTAERKPTKAARTAATTTQTRVAKPPKSAAGKSSTPARGSLAGTKTAPHSGYTWAAGDPAASSQDADPPTFPRKQTARRGNAAVGGRIKCEVGVKNEPPSGSLYDYPVAPPAVPEAVCGPGAGTPWPHQRPLRTIQRGPVLTRFPTRRALRAGLHYRWRQAVGLVRLLLDLWRHVEGRAPSALFPGSAGVPLPRRMGGLPSVRQPRFRLAGVCRRRVHRWHRRLGGRDTRVSGQTDRGPVDSERNFGKGNVADVGVISSALDL